MQRREALKTWDGKNWIERGGRGGVGCSQIWDFSYCPNMYLLKENLCPAELPRRQPGESSSGNRTCPYREGSWGERQHEGAGVKCFPRIWPFHWRELSEKKPPPKSLLTDSPRAYCEHDWAETAKLFPKKAQLLNQLNMQEWCLQMCESSNDERLRLLHEPWKHAALVFPWHWLTGGGEKREKDVRQKKENLSWQTNSPQMLLLSDTTGLPSNPAGQ